MTTIDIELDGTHVFVAGSPRTVSGAVLLHLSSPLAAAAVRIHLVGAAAWKYVLGGRVLSSSGVFLSRQCHWEPRDRTAPAGDSAVEFDLGPIDAGQPLSHEVRKSWQRAHFGYVRYYLEVHLVRRGRVVQRRYAPLSVVSLDRGLAGSAYPMLGMLADRLDPVKQMAALSRSQTALLEPATSEATKTFGFPHFASGQIDVSLSVPRRAYGYGEVIEAAVHVRNGSSTAVRDIEVRVCQTTHDVLTKWYHVLAATPAGCPVEPGKEADVLVRIRAPAAAAAFFVCRDMARGVYNTLDVAVRYKGLGYRLSTSIVIDLSSAPMGAEAGKWSPERMAELAETARPCIPWKVYGSKGDMLKGPHVQALCVPVDRACAPQRPLYGQKVVPEGEPLCDEPCFVAVDTDPALYGFNALGSIRYK
eukprot:m51a1_g216 hypothetical protein (418) ;mRNA; r:35674-37013